MSQAFETILMVGGKAKNLRYHEERMNSTRLKLFGYHIPLRLDDIVPPGESVYRCRVVYGDKIDSVQFTPYTKKKIGILKLVVSDIRYPYKVVDRDELDELFALRDAADDIIVVRDGLITDTTIANIALHDGLQWLTPKKPLLKGTMRQKLLDDGFLVEADILAEDLGGYQQIAIMNALRGFDILDIAPTNLIPN